MNKNSKKAASLALAASVLVGASLPAFAEETPVEEVKQEEVIEQTNTYEVKEGDTLSAISYKAYGNASFYQELAALNKIANPDLIEVGQTLIVPELTSLLEAIYGEDETYIVKPGDTLSDITILFYYQNSLRLVNKLATYNNLEDPNMIKVGEELQIPSLAKLSLVESKDYSKEYASMNARLPRRPHHIHMPHIIIKPGYNFKTPEVVKPEEQGRIIIRSLK